jgi:hypothetical protein
MIMHVAPRLKGPTATLLLDIPKGSHAEQQTEKEFPELFKHASEWF